LLAFDEYPECVETTPRAFGPVAIDGTTCKIARPINNPNLMNRFDGQTKVYSMDYTMVLDHDGLFILIDPVLHTFDR
jgi:hypothetical protein